MALRSMTGFGNCRMEREGIEVCWELRSVNNRFLDIKWQLPYAFKSLETELEKIVRTHAQRGRLEIFLSVRSSILTEICLDEIQAGHMLDAIKAFADSRGDTYLPDYSQLLKVPSLWRAAQSELDESFLAILKKTLEIAIDDWNTSRENEAKILESDLVQRIKKIGGWINNIEERAPVIKQMRIKQLHDRLISMLEALGSGLEESRFLQEVVIIADKLDVTEELTRLHAHLLRLDSILKNGNDAGKKLDFTLQECFREINTCGNKIQDAQVSAIIVDCKSELEKCREQVQNIE